MSPKNDFLSLCLAQAELSPLHYRHGAIIVRGGKVIGQGFNTYRPGFEASNLKTGTLPSASLDGPALAELKERLKSKTKKPKENQQDAGHISGSGHGSNTPLSMHSEMMAIHSALSLSSGTLSSQTSARAAKYLQKPCFSLPGNSKKRKARGLGLKAYAEAVCADASPTSSKVFKENKKPSDKEEGSTFHEEKQYLALKTENSAEKHRLKRNENEYSAPYPHESSHQPYQHNGGSEPQIKSPKTILAPDTNSSSSDTDFIRPKNKKSKTDIPKKLAPIEPNPQRILLTKNKTTNSKPDIASRTKDLRLKGSDIYVARLGSCSNTPSNRQSSRAPDPPPPSPPKSEPASLYDELSALSRNPSPATPPPHCPSDKPEIRASRPCYRCVSAMHSVGIKRVFWTNAAGEWEGAKVRDLADALENGGGLPGKDDGGDMGVFVTKHEVLMIKRLMGF